MSVASGITALVDAAITALNQRRWGASAYEIAVAQGYTGSQAAFLNGRSSRTMTTAQRLALTGDDLWTDREVTDTDTGYRWRYNGTAWKIWRIPWTTYTPTMPSFSAGSGGTVVNRWRIIEGDLELFARFALGTSGWAIPNTWYIPPPTPPASIGGASWSLDEVAFAATGWGSIQDTGTAMKPALVVMVDAGAMWVRAVRTDLAIANEATFDSAQTWAAGDTSQVGIRLRLL